MQPNPVMTAGDLCVRNVVTATAAESVVEVARRMAEFRVGDLIIVEERPPGLPRPIGIVTDRDLVIRVLARSGGVPVEAAIADVMTRELVTATEDDAVEQVVARMRDHAIRRIPIVDRRGGLQGLLGLDEVLGWMRDQVEAVTALLDRQSEGPLRHMPVR